MRKWIQTLMIGAVLVAPAAALAAIDGSAHDPTVQYGANTPKCAYCHSITGASGSTAAFGEVGAFCVAVCHNNTATLFYGDNNNVMPAAPGAFTGDQTGGFTVNGAIDSTNVLDFGAAHGDQPSGLEDPGTGGTGDAAVGGGATIISNTNWPHSTEAQLQCTTCHAVHDDTNPPFLNMDLSDGSGVAGSGFCEECHTGAELVNGGAAGRFSTGAHPTEIPYAGPGGTRTARLTLQALPVPSNMTTIRDAADGNNWILGGKLMTGKTPVAANTGLVGCYSCHTPHQDAANEGALVLGDTHRDYCYACHGGGPDTGALTAASGAVSQENPGTTESFHPVNTDTPLRRVIMDFTAEYDAWLATDVAGNAGYAPNYGGANPGPYCMTCHDVHGGMQGDFDSIRDFGVAGTSDLCEQCHIAPAYHHPTNTTTDYNASAGATDFGMPDPAWAGTTAGDPGDLGDGLQCVDCHANSGTAHNW